VTTKHPPGLRGWTDIGSDVSWEDYGGGWARRATDGSYFVLDFDNMQEACGSDVSDDDPARYVCEVKRVNLSTLPIANLVAALKSVGLRYVMLDDKGTLMPAGNSEGEPDLRLAIVSDSGDVVATEADTTHMQLVCIEACVSYGCAEPLYSATGATRPRNVRADARREAESLMRDAAKLRTALDRPVNKLGSTAEEYGRGDIESALNRGPFDVGKNLMRRLSGLPPVEE